MGEILLAGGAVLDGTGRPARREDVLIRGDRIVAIGVGERSPDWEVIDCAGLHVAPGFLDAHSHGDHEVRQNLPHKVKQGVTTEVVGNCGISIFPARAGCRQTNGERFGDDVDLPGAAAYLAGLETSGTRLNVAALTGNGTLREFIMGTRADSPNEEEFQAMERVLEECLEAGSLGLSTGLNILPSSFASTAEVIRLCGVVRTHGAYYTTHMRDYKFRVWEAIDEAIEIGRRADVPVQISHLQVVGQKNWAKLDGALERIERARASGLDIAMDAYPYLAGSCSLIQFLPGWCQEGGVPRLLERLASAAHRDRIARETDDNMANTWDDLVVSDVRTAANRTCVGKSIARLAAERDAPARLTAMNLLREEDGYVYVISFNNNEANLRRVLTHPLTSLITDGLVTEGLSHPRTFGAYPAFLGEYVREKRWMTLEEAIVKTSAGAARRFGFRGRGVLEAGGFADVVVFDAETIGTEADYQHPEREPRGIVHVLVNGVFAVRGGALTEARAGRPIRHVATAR